MIKKNIIIVSFIIIANCFLYLNSQKNDQIDMTYICYFNECFDEVVGCRKYKDNEFKGLLGFCTITTEQKDINSEINTISNNNNDCMNSNYCIDKAENCRLLASLEFKNKDNKCETITNKCDISFSVYFKENSNCNTLKESYFFNKSTNNCEFKRYKSCENYGFSSEKECNTSCIQNLHSCKSNECIDGDICRAKKDYEYTDKYGYCFVFDKCRHNTELDLNNLTLCNKTNSDWIFNNQTGKCEFLTYSGCNKVGFRTYKECDTKCSRQHYCDNKKYCIDNNLLCRPIQSSEIRHPKLGTCKSYLPVNIDNNDKDKDNTDIVTVNNDTNYCEQNVEFDKSVYSRLTYLKDTKTNIVLINSKNKDKSDTAIFDIKIDYEFNSFFNSERIAYNIIMLKDEKTILTSKTIHSNNEKKAFVEFTDTELEKYCSIILSGTDYTDYECNLNANILDLCNDNILATIKSKSLITLSFNKEFKTFNIKGNLKSTY